MKILNVRDAEFKAYGKVVEGLDVSSLLKALEETPKPDDVIYVASDEKLEYHRDSEVNVALTDLILILGKEQDIEAGSTYDTSKMEAFLVPAGTVIEVYATTLHYAPCNVNGNKFCTAVILPKGTNTDAPAAQNNTGEDKLLFARNKWLIAHKDAKIEGAFEGLIGENLSVKDC